MNVLAKILEEIKELKRKQINQSQDYRTGYFSALSTVEGIIRSHMNEVSTLEKKTVWEMDVIHHESYDLGRSVGWNECLEAIEYIENDGWIPVEEDLPKETEKEYYPVMYVTTSYGVIAWGFYRVKDEQWYLYNDIMEEFESVENNKIIAWQPLPEAYHPKQTPVAEHIMSRFTRVE